MSKLALGTVQFGLDYGINNRRGKIPRKEVFVILNTAYENDIDTIDTACDYGESEKVIGEFIKQKKINFKVISKLPSTAPKEVDEIIQISLKKLNINSFYGYLIHNFQTFLKTPEVYDLLNGYKKKRVIKKLGFSLYYPQELEYLFKNNVNFDIIQVPYNILDQRFASYFPKLKKRKVEIHARSVFLQGLLFKRPSILTGKFIKIKPKLKLLNDLSKKLNVPLAALCLNFVLKNNYIDKIVIGVDCKRNLEENVQSIKYQEFVHKIYKKLLLLKENNEDVILPFNWNR